MTEDPWIVPKRKHPRLKEFDYSQPGSYFVTLCTKNRKHHFGQIPVGRDAHIPPTIALSNIGVIANDFIQNISTSNEYVKVDNM